MTMKGGYRTIIFQVESFEPDVEQYKPAKPRLCPKNLFITVDVPEKYFVAAKGLPAGANCLTLKGLYKLKKVLIGQETFDGR